MSNRIDILVDGITVGSVSQIRIEEKRDKAPFYEIGSQNLVNSYENATVTGTLSNVKFTDVDSLFENGIVNRKNQKIPFDIAIIGSVTTHLRECWVVSNGGTVSSAFGTSVSYIDFESEMPIEYPKVESTRPDLNVSGEGVVPLSILVKIKYDGPFVNERHYGTAKDIEVKQELNLLGGGIMSLTGNASGIVMTDSDDVLFKGSMFRKQDQVNPFKFEIIERYAKFGRPMEKKHIIHEVYLTSDSTFHLKGASFKWKADRMEVGVAKKV